MSDNQPLATKKGGEIRCSDIREMQLQTTVPQTLWRDADNQPLITTKGGDQIYSDIREVQL